MSSASTNSLYSLRQAHNPHQLNHGVGSSVVSLKELLVQTDALQTVLLRLAPHAEARVRHSTVGVQDVVGGVSLNSLRAGGEIHRCTTTYKALTSV